MLRLVMTPLVVVIISCCLDEESRPAEELGKISGICLLVSPCVHLSSTLTNQL